MNRMIPDQKEVWDQKHKNGEHESLRHQPSPLSKLAESHFPRHASILELGCGVGRDAVFFARKGHTVVATDSSTVVIGQNKNYFPESGVDFLVLDMRSTLPYKVGSFDVVYSNLALHYYKHNQTEEIIQDISRVLKNKGVLAFACKSKDDIRTKDAIEVEKNVFIDPSGHALHIFSISYVSELLKNDFEIVHLDEIEEEYKGRISSIIRCIAKKSRKNWGEL